MGILASEIQANSYDRSAIRLVDVNSDDKITGIGVVGAKQVYN